MRTRLPFLGLGVTAGLFAATVMGQEPSSLPLLAPPSNSRPLSDTAPVQKADATEPRPAQPVPAARPGAIEELPLPGPRDAARGAESLEGEEPARSAFPLSRQPDPEWGDPDADGRIAPPVPRAAVGEGQDGSRWDNDRQRRFDPFDPLGDRAVTPSGRRPIVLRLNRLGLTFTIDPWGTPAWMPPPGPAGRFDRGDALERSDPPSILEPPTAQDDPDAQRPTFNRPATLSDRLRREPPLRRRPLRRLLGRLRN